MEPLRGEVWDAQLRELGGHSVIVLTVSTLVPRLSAVTVAVVTGTQGPEVTHIRLDRDAGLTGHDVSYANATDLHTLPKVKLRKRRGRLHPAEMIKLEDAVRAYLGL